MGILRAEKSVGASTGVGDGVSSRGRVSFAFVTFFGAAFFGSAGSTSLYTMRPSPWSIWPSNVLSSRA